MGLDTLPTRGDTTIVNDWFNKIHAALKIDLVPRNASGIPADLAGSLGTSDYSWKNAFIQNLTLDGTPLDASLLVSASHRIRSGKAKASGYPDFLTPAGLAGGLSATLDASTTDFESVINGSSFTFTSDIGFTGLSPAPSANNTCRVNDAGLAGAESTKLIGEYQPSYFLVDTIGSEIEALDGTVAAFKKGSEVFLARVDFANTRLYPLFRGWAGTARETLTDNDTITL